MTAQAGPLYFYINILAHYLLITSAEAGGQESPCMTERSRPRTQTLSARCGSRSMQRLRTTIQVMVQMIKLVTPTTSSLDGRGSSPLA